MYKTIQHFCCLFYQITLIWIFLKLIICVTKWPFNLDLILLNTWSTVSDHDIKFFVLNNNLNLDSQNWLYRDNKHWWLSATTCCKCEELALYISSVNKSEGRSELDTAFFFFLFFFYIMGWDIFFLAASDRFQFWDILIQLFWAMICWQPCPVSSGSYPKQGRLESYPRQGQSESCPRKQRSENWPFCYKLPMSTSV